MMKKIFYAILACGLATAAIAQDATTPPSTTEAPVLKSRKGEPYLPVTDEWALGVSANPFLDYLGNFVNGTDGNSAPSFNYADNIANRIAVFGKLMKDEHTAYRIRFNVGVGSRTNKAVVVQNQLNPDPAFPAFTEDWQKVNTTSIVIAPGIEKRRGSTRLQGVYGAELVIGYNSSKVTYDYGNTMSADFPGVITNNFGSNIVVGPPANATARVTEDKTGASFLVGARGFIGVEYFIAPKISLGGEFGYMFGFQSLAKSTITSESFDGADLSIRETKTDVFRNGNGVNSIGIGLDNLNGSINLLFYF
jgi:hypothetical protein